MKNLLIVLLGPTGVGKTDISVDLAEKLNCEIISADSRQFFKEMKIGTSVPSDNQLNKIKHHFIQFLSVETYYSASLFERDVLQLLNNLWLTRNIVLMTGGSGLYIDAVCKGYDDIPDIDNTIRDKYISLYKNEGISGLRVALKLLDPDHYAKVDLKNHKRIIRALEICEATGRPYSSFLRNERRERDFTILKIGLKRDRDELYNRINSRVDDMIKNGLEDEARRLYKFKATNALNSVGYKEFFDYFENKISHEKAMDLIKRNTRRYAKRQMTWWSRDNEIRWFEADEYDKILDFINECSKPEAFS